jgi:hypothetical protein
VSGRAWAGLCAGAGALAVGVLACGPGAATAGAPPLPAQWSAVTYRWSPLGLDASGTAIPLDGIADCAGTRLESAQLVGRVVSESGADAAVRARCRTTSDGAGVEAWLSFDGLDKPGDYTGTIDVVDDGTELGQVELSVRYTDDPLLAAVLIGAGIVLALWVVRWVNRRSLVDSADVRALGSLAAALAADAAFQAASSGKAWHAYRIGTSAAVQVAGVRAQLQALSGGYTELDRDDKELQSAVEPLAALDELARDWRAFPGELDQLETALVPLASPPPDVVPPPATATRELAVRGRLLRLLAGDGPASNGAGELSLDEARQLMADAESGTAVAAAWVGQGRRLRQLRERAERLGALVDGVEPEDQRLVAEAHQEISELTGVLWTSEDLAELSGMDARLDGVQQRLSRLDRYFAPGAASPFGVAGNGSSSSPASSLREVSRQASRLDRRRRGSDALVVVVLAVVALGAGLAALYAGKPFGSISDYASAVLWGFGAQAVLAGLVLAVDRLSTLGVARA